MTGSLSTSYKCLADEYQKHLVGDVEPNASEREELRWRRLNYYVFAVFVVLIGLPIWYFTTTPHRARLPYFGDEYRTRIQEFLDAEGATSTNASGDVWLQTTLSPRYNIHVIFVHDTGHYDSGELRRVGAVRRILDGIEKFTRVFAASLRSALSAEHFFDFSLAEFLESENLKKKSAEHNNLLLDGDGGAGVIAESLTVEAARASALTAQIDALGTPPLTSADPLVKIVVFVPGARGSAVRFMDAEGKPANGLAVASWGGFVALSPPPPTKTISHQPPSAHNANDGSVDGNDDDGDGGCLGAIFGLLRLQLGIVAARERMRRSPTAERAIAQCESRARNGGKVGGECRAPERDAIYHKLLATGENLAQIVHLIDSLHDLGAKIEDLVISEEVAKLANAAHENFFRVYAKLVGRRESDFDPSASLNARDFAETAITHPSLLEYLNFPSDQKYGIYVPLFFPVLVPLLFPLASVLAFVARRKFSPACQPKLSVDNLEADGSKNGENVEESEA